VLSRRSSSVFSASDVDRWGRYGLASPPASLSNKQQ